MYKKVVGKLIDECTETIEEAKLAEITIFENENMVLVKCILYWW